MLRFKLIWIWSLSVINTDVCCTLTSSNLQPLYWSPSRIKWGIMYNACWETSAAKWCVDRVVSFHLNSLLCSLLLWNTLVQANLLLLNLVLWWVHVVSTHKPPPCIHTQNSCNGNDNLSVWVYWLCLLCVWKLQCLALMNSVWNPFSPVGVQTQGNVKYPFPHLICSPLCSSSSHTQGTSSRAGSTFSLPS